MVRVYLHEVTKIFGKNVVALDKVELEVRSGEFMVVMGGPSGHGKTTLLRVVAGLEEPTDGEVWIGDTLVASPRKGIFIPPKDRNVGMVFQNWALYPHMKVFDNIAFPLRIKKLPKSEIEKKVREIAEVLVLPKRWIVPKAVIRWSAAEGGHCQSLVKERRCSLWTSHLAILTLGLGLRLGHLLRISRGSSG